MRWLQDQYIPADPTVLCQQNPRALDDTSELYHKWGVVKNVHVKLCTFVDQDTRIFHHEKRDPASYSFSWSSWHICTVCISPWVLHTWRRSGEGGRGGSKHKKVDKGYQLRGALIKHYPGSACTMAESEPCDDSPCCCKRSLYWTSAVPNSSVSHERPDWSHSGPGYYS